MARSKAARYLALGALAVLAPVTGVFSAAPAGAATSIIISEVAPWGSGDAPYAADWFELTNTTGSAINISGWKVDDNSNSFASALTLTGVTSIPAGGSAIFLEGGATQVTNFISAWFGGSPPPGLQVGSYSGSGIGLSTSGDAVNIYNGAGVLQANVTFGTADATAPFQSFDNAAGLAGAITLLSSNGVNGAFIAASDPNEIGSPGVIANSTPVPEVPYLVLIPATGLALMGGFLYLGRKRAAAATTV